MLFRYAVRVHPNGMVSDFTAHYLLNLQRRVTVSRHSVNVFWGKAVVIGYAFKLLQIVARRAPAAPGTVKAIGPIIAFHVKLRGIEAVPALAAVAVNTQDFPTVKLYFVCPAQIAREHL